MLFILEFVFMFTIKRLSRVVLINILFDIIFYNTYYIVALKKIGQNNMFYSINYLKTDYILETILFLYYLSLF